jgi:putative two-component system hydrogenase maturation factor HypX/HoxX
MRILFLTTAHNSLSQRLMTELTERGHDIRVCVAASGEAMIAAAAYEVPELIIAPMLKIAIPDEVWTRHLCLIVHPGIKGDRGPSSLDWAVAEGQKVWGVTIIEAAAEMDAGPIWASREFRVPVDLPSKSHLYRGAVTEAAVQAVLEAASRIESGAYRYCPWQPELLSYDSPAVRGRLRRPKRQADRAIDWLHDTTAMIIRKVRAADSVPGVLSTLLGRTFYLYGVHEEEGVRGDPGRVLAYRDGAICIGTVDGAVWISHLKATDVGEARQGDAREFHEPGGPLIAGIKLPATQVLGPLLHDLPEAPRPMNAPKERCTFREITYSEEDDVGYLTFDFYNGAMSTSQCVKLRDAFLHARSRPTRAIVLLGGRDFWSNGIHLNTIEAAADPAEESWHNINAIDDLVFEILNAMSHLVIAGMRGNAGAGGAMMALAADQVYARSGIVINPHYKKMGDLYGSEYWTYTLPRRVGQSRALDLTEACRPIGTREAVRIGFLDDAFGEDPDSFEAALRVRVQRLVHGPDFFSMLRNKREKRQHDEALKPLAAYRAEELNRMRVNFFGSDPAYHDARRRFVFKGKPPLQEIPRADIGRMPAYHASCVAAAPLLV